MKRVIDISQSYFEMLKYDVEHGGDGHIHFICPMWNKRSRKG